RAIKQGKDATEVDAALVNESAHEIYGKDLPIDDAMVRGALEPESFVQAHTVKGGPAREPMQAALSAAHEQCRADLEIIDGLADKLRESECRLDGEVDI